MSHLQNKNAHSLINPIKVTKESQSGPFLPLRPSVIPSTVTDSTQCKSKITEDFFMIFQCVCVCVWCFWRQRPRCRESCGKGVRPEDVSTLASDNVSLRDTACHFTQPHIKKESGGMEEKTACHLFALIQLTQRRIGRLSSVRLCVRMSLVVFVCPACGQKEFGFRDISEMSCNELRLKKMDTQEEWNAHRLRSSIKSR